MAWTPRQQRAIGLAFCELCGIPTDAIGKPGVFIAFLEATKAQQAAVLKPIIQAKRDANQADSDAAPTIATTAQTLLAADNVELDALLGTL